MTSTRTLVLVVLGIGCVSGATYRKSPIPQHADQVLRDAYPYWEPIPVVDEVGDTLILTPYIEAGKIEEARNLSFVSGGPFPEDIPAYSGFFTVNKEFNSNLFFWFFPCEVDYENAPVILWLNGGPGTSSLYGLFIELGPFNVGFDDVSLVKNPYSWHKNHSLIFIDNPVGTGFSFTDFTLGYATNQTQVGSELYIAMLQFYKLFPELQSNEFFISGESFAGKYVPALAYTIHINNPTAEMKINLQGIAVGNGFTDPPTVLSYSKFCFQMGLVNNKARDEMDAREQKARDDIASGSWVSAWQEWNNVVILWRVNSEFTYNYNIRYQNAPVTGGNYWTFVQSSDVRKRLHVGPVEYTSDGPVYTKMIPEFMMSVKPWLQVLMENYRVLYYNGHLDVAIGYPMSVSMYQTLEWSGKEEYQNATRQPWYVGPTNLAGYMRRGGNFTEVLVRNAGHMVPEDQPLWALDLITKFTFNNMP